MDSSLRLIYAEEDTVTVMGGHKIKLYHDCVFYLAGPIVVSLVRHKGRQLPSRKAHRAVREAAANRKAGSWVWELTRNLTLPTVTRVRLKVRSSAVRFSLVLVAPKTLIVALWETLKAKFPGEPLCTLLRVTEVTNVCCSKQLNFGIICCTETDKRCSIKPILHGSIIEKKYLWWFFPMRHKSKYIKKNTWPKFQCDEEHSVSKSHRLLISKVNN